MSLIPLQYPPGVCKVDSPYATQGRYTDMNKIRFVKGRPEKIGGNINVSNNPFADLPYGQIADNKAAAAGKYLVIGCNTQLNVANSITSVSQVDITPLRAVATGTLGADPFATTSGSAIVTVTHTAHGLLTNDVASFSGATAVAGVTVLGPYFITRIDANSYTIVANTTASGSTSGGGASVLYTYYRVTLGSNPFATISGSPVITVTHSSHGAVTGDWVTYTGATAVAGITVGGSTYKITKVNANSYTINPGINANATTAGGGTPSAVYSISLQATAFGQGAVWALSRYGYTMLACPVSGVPGTTPVTPSTIYVYDPFTPNSQLARPYPLLNAPAACAWMFVTPERFVFALGTTTPMMVQWPDQADYTQWTATATNSANSRTLQEGSFLVGGVVVRDFVSMIFSNTAAYTFTYTGDNNVYASQLVGKECGLVSPQAAVTFNGVVYWMSFNDFWMWNGSVQKLPSDDIRDFVFNDLTVAIGTNNNAGSCVVGVNSAKNEIWFYYPSGADNRAYATRYAIYHIDQNCFSTGTMTVLSYLDRGLFMNPVFSGFDSNLYNSENGTTIQANTDAINTADDAYVTFSPMDISHGDKNMDIFSFIPDFERQTGNCLLTIFTQDYPNDAIVTAGTYTLSTNTQKADFRLGAKLIGGKIENNTAGGDFRLGLPRADAQPAGARR